MSELRFFPYESCAALIFDCDGTLVDSAPVHLAGYNASLSGYGKVMSWEWYSSRLGVPARDLLLVFAEEFDVSLDIDQAMLIYTNSFHENLDLIREVTLVAEIARTYRGRLPLAVASNGSGEHVIASLEKAGLLPLFDVIVGREAVIHGKPAPDLYIEAARRLGVPSERCVVFEDSPEGMQAARRAGMKAYDVSFALAGYRR